MKSGEPLSTMPKRLPPSLAGRILEIRCSRKSSEPSLTRGRPGPKRPLKPMLLGLFANHGFDLLPLHAEGRIGKHVVEDFRQQAVGGEGVAEDDVGDVLALDEHVGLADGVGLGVQFLAVHDQPGVGVQAGEVLAGHAQHAARAGGGVVEGAHDAGLGQGVVVLDEEQIHHQPDDFARGEVLSGGLVGKLGELADEFLEDRAHLGIADGGGVQVDVGELLRDEVEQPGLGQPVDLGVEVEPLEDVAHGGRERLDVGAEVLADVVLVAHELLQVQRRRVVEKLAGLPQEERLGVHAGLLALGQLGEHGGLGGFQHAIETAEDRERQDDLAVFGLLVVAAQEIGDGPDEGGEIGVAHAGSLLRRGSGKWAGPADRRRKVEGGSPAGSISSRPRCDHDREPEGIVYRGGRDRGNGAGEAEAPGRCADCRRTRGLGKVPGVPSGAAKAPAGWPIDAASRLRFWRNAGGLGGWGWPIGARAETEALSGVLGALTGLRVGRDEGGTERGGREGKHL